MSFGSRFSRDVHQRAPRGQAVPVAHSAHSLVQPGRSTQHLLQFSKLMSRAAVVGRFHHTLSANTARKQEKDSAEIALIRTSHQFYSNCQFFHTTGTTRLPDLPETSLTKHLRAFEPALCFTKLSCKFLNCWTHEREPLN